MASNAPPVPSKNALRALRNLAFANPTIIFGAVGSACCAAAVSYEAQRRVRLAEQIIATKRTLRSISDGKGNARARRMFEAAEKGENFLLDPRSAGRRQRVRTHSTAIAQQDDVDNEEASIEIENIRQSLAQIPERAQSRTRRRLTSTRKDKNYATEAPVSSSAQPAGNDTRHTLSAKTPSLARRHSQANNSVPNNRSPVKGDTNTANSFLATHKLSADVAYKPHGYSSHGQAAASYAWAMDSQRQRNSASGEKVRAASMRSHKTRDYVVYGARRRQPPLDASLPSELTSTEASQPSALGGEHIYSISTANDNPRDCARPDDGWEAMADPTRLSSTEARRGANGGEKDLLNPGFDDVGEFQASTASFRRAQSDPHMHASRDNVSSPSSGTEYSQQRPFEWQSPVSDFVDLSASAAESSTGVTEEELRWVRAVGINTPDLHELEMGAYSAHVREGGLSAVYRPLKSFSSVESPFVFRHKIAAALVAGDLDEAERTFSENYNRKLQGSTPVIAIPLIRKLLADPSRRHRAAKILFPEPRRQRTRSTVQGHFARVYQYLRVICATTPNCDEWVVELRKVLDMAQAEAVELNASILLCVIQYVCGTGQVAKAEKLANSLSDEYGLEWHIDLDRVLVLAYATEHDWSPANRIMQSLQDRLVPRERPHWYSSLFRDVFERYLQDHALEPSYDYLVNAMSSWRLAPTSAISCTLIGACIRAGDYGRLRQWSETIRVMWPRLDIGTGLRANALQLDTIWAEQQATCEDIEKACLAMAFDCEDDPFSQDVRAIIQHAIESDLRRQISNCAMLSEKAHIMIKTSYTLPTLLRIGDQLLTQLDESSEPHQSAAYESLSRQLLAVARLNKVMAGCLPETPFNDAIWHESVPIAPETVDSVVPKDDLTPSIPTSLQSPHLPHIKLILPILAEHYLQQQQSRKPLSHDLLEYIISKLKYVRRLDEAASLMDLITRSPFVTGKGGKSLSPRLYSDWLDIATQLMSTRHAGKAMWALLDACRHVVLSPKMLMQAADCNAMFLPTGYAHRPVRRQKEIQYLYKRLERIRWVQMGMPNLTPSLPRWRTWGERMQEEEEHVA
ncbi:uncharacterized protein HMPREF1541_04816 [Cyphellophora europaea CBS 101466]|uniref:Uncharacterized protein n=1 Tax=Cyphellophora europaea (strain CBS 101466) TaxID=1220924 RepID=W2RXZ2_CYPE1|nr:uncharacterized protein HMPREF1541_04816 [Cyphellophora europaea CBS 101466]ETN40539.1 hypothetical protein HMPREF1541_04816 [Cyphellophora europaea CBS 101466]